MKRRAFLGLLLAAPAAAVAAVKARRRLFFRQPPYVPVSEDAMPEYPDLEPVFGPEGDVIEYWTERMVTTVQRNTTAWNKLHDEYKVIRRARNPFKDGRIPWKVIGDT